VAIVLLVASLMVMPILAAAKTRIGKALKDNLILADAVETKICVLLSISTLVGVGLFQLTGAAWLDPVAGFVIAAFAIHEGREASHGKLVDDDWVTALFSQLGHAPFRSTPKLTKSCMPIWRADRKRRCSRTIDSDATRTALRATHWAGIGYDQRAEVG
jgi:hypothetical protein